MSNKEMDKDLTALTGIILWITLIGQFVHALFERLSTGGITDNHMLYAIINWLLLCLVYAYYKRRYNTEDQDESPR